jgi:prepilin-type processing-associated H-X9-DG protein
VENSGLIASASSNHTGGVNAAMCDGSVTFVSDTVHCGDLNTTPLSNINEGGNAGNPPSVTIRAKTYYGIWGGLGSRNGKESTGL